MFQGFTEETVQFMWDIRFNNRRDWFMEHKQTYVKCFYEPLKELASEVQERFLQQNPGLELNVKVARIYRDVRVVRDGKPYKDHLWFSMRTPAEHSAGHPGFFFGVEPEGYSVGLDFWATKPSDMEQYRQRILSEPKKLEKLARLLNGQERFTLHGDRYKRLPKRIDEVSDLLKPWFDRKGSVWIASDSAYEDGCSFYGSELVDEILEGFQWLLPFFRWFEELEMGQ